MMKRFVFAFLMVAAAAASASELGDADKALQAKQYDKAFPIYSRLANAGNTEAQFRLGEMYWYGDGTAVDMAKSRIWLQKAASAGHGGARDTLAVLKEREKRTADLAYWTTGYKGEDLVSGKYACPMPKIPAVSKTTEEINRVGAEIANWETCYNGFVAGLNGIGGPDKRIPADVLNLMTPREAEQAVAHLNDVTVAVVDRRQAEAMAFSAQRDAWAAATQQFVAEANARVAASNKEHEIAMNRTREDQAEYLRRIPTASFNPAPTPAPGKK
jgi:hypothetical protein